MAASPALAQGRPYKFQLKEGKYKVRMSKNDIHISLGVSIVSYMDSLSSLASKIARVKLMPPTMSQITASWTDIMHADCCVPHCLVTRDRATWPN